MLDDMHDTTLSRLRNQALEQALRSDEDAYCTLGAENEQFYVSKDGPLSRLCERTPGSAQRRIPANLRAAACGTKCEFQKETVAWPGYDEIDEPFDSEDDESVDELS